MFGSTLFLCLLTVVAVQDPAVDSATPDSATPEGPTVDALVIQHEMTGRPGSPEETTSVQNALVSSDRVLVEDRSRGLVSILRLDQAEPLLWEVSADQAFYRETKDLGRIQKDRVQQEKQLLRRVADLPAAERESLLKANHIRVSEDGELVREITVEENATDEIRHDLPVRNVRILENGRLIVDALVADVDIPFSLAKFHSASGAFSEQVLEALEKVKGLPLEGSIQVVTATLSHSLQFKVTQWHRSSEIPLSVFDLPPDCQKIEEKSFVNCPVCGSEVERDASAARARKRDGSWYYFDRRSCFQDWRKERLGG
jgi:YHS domain-containing protein